MATINQEDEFAIEQWFEGFKATQEGNPTDDEFMMDLAIKLKEDSPIGYIASTRLANWIMCYVNQPKIQGEKLRKLIKLKEFRQEYYETRLDQAFVEYKSATKDLMDIFKSTFDEGIENGNT